MEGSHGRPSHYRWMIAILLLAFLLRIPYLDRQSLWWDEAFSFSVSVADLPTLLESTVHDRVHPPLYYTLMHFWLALGHDELLLRFFSVLFGVISVSIMYIAASIVGGKSLGTLAALLLAVIGLVFLYLMSARTEVPVILVSDITPMMNFAHVRVTGTVERAAYVSRHEGEIDYLSFSVDDGSGRLRIAAYGHVAQTLAESGRVPKRGAAVARGGARPRALFCATCRAAPATSICGTPRKTCPTTSAARFRRFRRRSPA